MKPKLQVVLIALVIILILAGEVIVYAPQRSPRPTVVIETYPSADALVQALSNGEVDMAPVEGIAPQTLLQLKNNPNLNIVPINNFGFTYIGLNLRNSPLNNSVFREAMLYGFNRERLLNYSLEGYGEVLSPGLFSSAYAALGWRNESINSYPYDPTKASELLDSIGFMGNSSGTRIDPSTGQQLRTMFIYSKLTDPQAVTAANLFAEDMRAIGLPIISFPETDFDFQSQMSVTYNFDLLIETEPATAAPTWLYELFAGANDIYPAPLSTNLVGYHNSNFDIYAKQMMTAASPDSAREAALRCQEELALDLPVLPVYSRNLLLVEQKPSVNVAPVTGSLPDTIAATLTNITGTSVVRIGVVGGLSDIDPAIALGVGDSLALRLITDSLIVFSSDGSPQPGLVDRWQMSDNATNLTLHLREGLDFRDGTPVTAHDLAATINWLVANMVPSTPLYPTLEMIKRVTEVDDYTVMISLKQPNYFAIDGFRDLFALPANTLPQGNAALSLLLSGALQSTGQFELTKFVQGAEVELQPASSAGSYPPSFSGVQAQDLFGSSVGGSQIQITSDPLNYQGQSIENATFTVEVHDGDTVTPISGIYSGLGVYVASLNLDTQFLSIGNHIVAMELYGQLPTGVILQFEQRNLVVYAPLFLGQMIVYLMGVAAVGFIAYSGIRARRKRKAKKRGRRGHRPRTSRSKRRS